MTKVVHFAEYFTVWVRRTSVLTAVPWLRPWTIVVTHLL